MNFLEHSICISLEMALKSFNISKLDHQMSKRWNKIAAHAFETTYYQIWQDEKLSTWLLSSGQDFRKNNQMHWLQYDRKHFSIFLFIIFAQTFSPRCRTWSKLQSIKHEKKPLWCVWKLYSIMLNRKSTWNVTFLKCLVPSTYIFSELCLLMKLWQIKCDYSRVQNST